MFRALSPIPVSSWGRRITIRQVLKVNPVALLRERWDNRAVYGRSRELRSR
jgi:hypothetical protein